MLPYFCKTERHYDPGDTSKAHGHHGPVQSATVTSSGRKYPLRQPLLEAWKSLGLKYVADVNGGSPLGVAECVEARIDGKRVVASVAYSLEGVTVLTSTLVRRVLLSIPTDVQGIPTAIGVELANGTTYTGRREVILSAGAFGTPQILMLSGIGPTSELAKHGITQLVDSPGVGHNLWDHLRLAQVWKLRKPELGLAQGSPAFNNPIFAAGNPIDFVTTSSVPQDGLREALAKDRATEQAVATLAGSGERCHISFHVKYRGRPYDGTNISTNAMNFLPTSRGTVTLASTDPEEKAVVDSNHYATEADRYRMRTAVKNMCKMMNAPAMKEWVSGEVVPDGFVALTEDSTDEDIDARLYVDAL